MNGSYFYFQNGTLHVNRSNYEGIIVDEYKWVAQTKFNSRYIKIKWITTKQNIFLASEIQIYAKVKKPASVFPVRWADVKLRR